ncbi:RagB/SusD family nutrient uptake outer membrane protein [Niabella beijingensis]|uniref:RagB/SusD family nutrient uptake outer membrane protein n=1 Tax=Niabella beijingensis TaxID=2872700 RepID=UPI001CC07A33|nr:RagB/SusD family nutrient uptake outer membrane protein [Niabella beijingensis]MBZ4190200.1 RagB/SusD family nutrient uptake outer membrane protein [Niabella beijingensis]
MKKLIYSIAVITAVIQFYSCQKLDIAPISKFTEANYWTDIDKAKLMLNMGYNQMYSAGIMWRDEFLSDNMVHTYGTSDQNSIRRGEATASLNLFANEWKDAYGGIKTCLVFLANVDRVPGMPEATKNRMIDEIRFIRAYLYFRLVNYYGDVPFFTTEISLDDAYKIKRTPKNEILAFIHSELDDIMNRGNLPRAENLVAEEKGRITIGAACAFQARAYLYEGNYQKVKEYAGYLINDPSKYGAYQLFQYPAKKEESYFMLFTPENEYNNEVILDITYVPNLKYWTNMSQMAPISKNAEISADNPTQELVDCYLTMNGLPVKGTGKDPAYNENDPYVNRDPRLSATVVYDNYKWQNKNGSVDVIRTAAGTNTSDSYKGPVERQTKTGYYVHKYYDWTMTPNNQSGLNIIMFRFADVLLMYAEACNELGKITQQEWDTTIRPIRERAGFKVAAALDYPAAKSQGEIRDVIRNERRVELALEGLRWYDVKRWKIGQEVLNGTMHGFRFSGAGGDTDGGYVRVNQYKFNDNRDYLWSVPLTQMDLNQNLKPNNPGY